MTAQEMALACGLPPLLSYTVAETSRYSGVPESTLRRAIGEGELACVLLRGCKRGRRVRPEDLDAWMMASRTEGAA